MYHTQDDIHLCNCHNLFQTKHLRKHTQCHQKSRSLNIGYSHYQVARHKRHIDQHILPRNFRINPQYKSFCRYILRITRWRFHDIARSYYRLDHLDSLRPSHIYLHIVLSTHCNPPWSHNLAYTHTNLKALDEHSQYMPCNLEDLVPSIHHRQDRRPQRTPHSYHQYILQCIHIQGGCVLRSQHIQNMNQGLHRYKKCIQDYMTLWNNLLPPSHLCIRKYRLLVQRYQRRKCKCQNLSRCIPHKQVYMYPNNSLQ